MTYPDGEALTYSYQDNLLLDGVQSSIDSLNLVSSVSYKDIGLPDSYTLGSSPTTATQSFEYWKIDDTARSPYGALKRTKLTKDSTDLVNREMQYDAVGNVTKIVDGVNSETIDYTYDDLDRLLTASVPSGESFVYNTIGNMTSKSGATLDYGTTSPKHGVKTYGSASYTYDANGSMTAKGDLSIKYDPEHRPVRVQDGETIYRVAYDGDGVRRKRLDSNGTIHYLGDYERNVGNGSDTTEVVTKYYYGTFGPMSRLIAFRRAGELYWAGTDHLGGTIRVMDSSFAAVDGMRYEPYGEDRDTGSSLNTDRKFTGQTEDQSIGLYWYASRAYDPDTGRFCTPDPIVPAPGYPQSLNRYSYVYNNPLKYVDPTGHYSVEDDKKWEKEYWDQYGWAPTASDQAFRQASMEAAEQGRDFSVEYWAGQLERAASNIAGSVSQAATDVLFGAANTAYDTAQGLEVGIDLPPTALPLIDWQGLQYTLGQKLKIIDREAAKRLGRAKGGRLFHLDFKPAQGGWHFNADIGPLHRYDHMKPLQAVRAMAGDVAKVAGRMKFPTPFYVPAYLFEEYYYPYVRPRPVQA